ncbi:MAG: hypothetical protein DRI56_06875 [Chloroflexota bacterium]|nr:MAG: hypothetical protein DRI56_06875 [Chloroflexota bacterium]
MTPTVFVDANIIIAGSASRKGASRVVLGQAEYGMIQLVVTRQVLVETERNIRLKFPKILPALSELLMYINLQILDDPEPHQYERWLSIIEAKDAPILEAAVQFAPDYLLTLNSKDFTPEVARATGLVIQSPGEFVSNIRHIVSQNL